MVNAALGAVDPVPPQRPQRRSPDLLRSPEPEYHEKGIAMAMVGGGRRRWFVGGDRTAARIRRRAGDDGSALT